MTDSIAIIPARAGSKRIKNKNIKIFYNKPMIYWSIKTAINSKLFNRVFVSTDSEKIASVSRKYGAEVPFLRSKLLSNDIISPTEAVRDLLMKLEKQLIKINYVCCIYPCSPLILERDLKNTFKRLKSNKDKFIFPVSEYPHPIQRAFTLNKNDKVIVREKNKIGKRTQDLKNFYHDTGQFYWGEKKSWVKRKDVISNGNGYIIPSWRSLDIDNENDWIKAELLFKGIKEIKNFKN